MFEGGENSLSALDVSAITNASPTPVKCSKEDPFWEAAGQSKLEDTAESKTQKPEDTSQREASEIDHAANTKDE